MLIVFLQQNNAIHFHSESIKAQLVFQDLSYFLKHKEKLAYKTLRVITTLFFSNFFQSSFPDGNSIPSHLFLFIKDLIFVIFSGYFPLSSGSSATIIAD